MEFNDGIDIPMKRRSFHNESPIPIHVVTVEYDYQTSLDLQNMLNSFGYQVTKCEQGDEALVLLRTEKEKYSIVITSDHLHGNINGFDLLTTVSSELQLPIIMISSDNGIETKLKANLHGCCEYMVKPISSDSLKNIWEHVIRHAKKLRDFELNLQPCSQNITNYNSNSYLKNNIEMRVHEGKELEEKGAKVIERGIEDVNGIFEDERQSDMYSAAHMANKRRLVWSENLHKDFIAAINQIGDHVVPKKILENMRRMGYKNLSRENVASHLQKYRDSNKKCQKRPKTYSHGVASQDQIFSTPEINNNNNNNEFQNNSLSKNNVLNHDTNNRFDAISSNHGVVLQQTLSRRTILNNNNNYYYYKNNNVIINNNNPIVSQVKLDQQQSLMSYQNSSQPIVDDQFHDDNGENDNESFSFWKYTYLDNSSADQGLTLNELKYRTLLIPNMPHETSNQPHQGLGMQY